jgi:hypothetical protein
MTVVRTSMEGVEKKASDIPDHGISVPDLGCYLNTSLDNL